MLDQPLRRRPETNNSYFVSYTTVFQWKEDDNMDLDADIEAYSVEI